jgi:DNA-binding NtrC family response regulator
LRERRNDIIPLAEHYLKYFSEKYKTEKLLIDDDVKYRLENMVYKGNVRELRGIMEESTIIGSFENLNPNYELTDNTIINNEINDFRIESLAAHSDKYISEIYEFTNHNIKETCKILGISRSTLWRKLSLFQNAT